MSILILGGRGNLGTQLVKILSVDHEVVAWDRDDLDVLDFNLLAKKIRELQPAVIINTVAYNAVDKCEEAAEYALALKLNADLPGVLADLARELRAILIHYSSDYVFSGTVEKQTFKEGETPNPVNKYGKSKARGEREIEQRAAKGLKYYLIRTSKLFGPQGASPAAKPSFFDIMLSLAQTKKELTVVNEELSCFTYTPDLADATLRLLEAESSFGIYHLVNEEAVTWYQAVVELWRLAKLTVPLRAVRSENLLRVARRPKFSVLLNTKVKKLRPWKLALKEYLHDYNPS
jgi:dTDP-4-dehydrorhamnose reductase